MLGFRNLAVAASAVGAWLWCGSAASAATTIIDFGQTSTKTTTVTATETGSASGTTTIHITDKSANITEILGGAPVNNVYVNLNATSTYAVFVYSGHYVQDYRGTFCIASGKGCTGTNYLSGSFTDAWFGMGSSASITVSDPSDTLTLTSSVIPASDLLPPSGLSISFTSITPGVHAVDGTIASFSASFAGDASASAIPEPSTWFMAVLGFVGLGYAAFRRGRRTAISID